ncbi:M91 family zinc metallopeptidase [Streptomyces sp. JW3]|uniref:M91 family zinc metallopeptidase n=1 Tax=Streptomyces sp. JW3 TaxID=3456955 RepID=UPI003FA4C2E3
MHDHQQQPGASDRDARQGVPLPRPRGRTATTVLPLQRTAGNMAVNLALRQGRTADAAAPVQRMMKLVGGLTGKGRAPSGPKEIAGWRGRLQEIAAAHPRGEPSQAVADAWGSALDALEHEVYRWFAASRGASDADKKLVADVMDEIQAEHRRYTRFVVQGGFTPHMEGPVSDTSRETWAKLSGNQGVTVAETGENDVPAGDDFKTSVHAMNARLMSRPHGRTLLDALVADSGNKPQVTVKAIDDARLEKMRTAEFGIPDLHEDAQVGPDDDRAYAQDGKGGPIGKGQPSTSTMHLERGYLDSTGGRADPDAKPPRGYQDPLSPAFMIYGHELIHALHNKHGVNVANVGTTSLPEEHETVGIDSGNPHTTAFMMNNLLQNHITEADLRKEHGLPARTRY